MPITTTRPNVTTGAAVLVGTPAAGFAKNGVKARVLTDGVTVYFGGPDVTTSNGDPVTSEDPPWECLTEHAVWAVASATASVALTVVPVSS